jgi:hypothetical protein
MLMSEHAQETQDDVANEMNRIRRLFEFLRDDKEDLISYAKEIVALRSVPTVLSFLAFRIL